MTSREEKNEIEKYIKKKQQEGIVSIRKKTPIEEKKIYAELGLLLYTAIGGFCVQVENTRAHCEYNEELAVDIAEVRNALWGETYGENPYNPKHLKKRTTQRYLKDFEVISNGKMKCRTASSKGNIFSVRYEYDSISSNMPADLNESQKKLFLCYQLGLDIHQQMYIASDLKTLVKKYHSLVLNSENLEEKLMEYGLDIWDYKKYKETLDTFKQRYEISDRTFRRYLSLVTEIMVKIYEHVRPYE